MGQNLEEILNTQVDQINRMISIITFDIAQGILLYSWPIDAASEKMKNDYSDGLNEIISNLNL